MDVVLSIIHTNNSIIDGIGIDFELPRILPSSRYKAKYKLKLSVHFGREKCTHKPALFINLHPKLAEKFTNFVHFCLQSKASVTVLFDLEKNRGAKFKNDDIMNNKLV
jgi:hypothetical protein